jgi:REP element-mobilizing transposase RayT
MASAYLFSLQCYGTSRRPDAAPRRRSQPPYILDPRRRQLAIDAVRQACALHGWTLVAVRAQPDAIAVIVAAETAPAVAVQRELRESVSRRLHQAGIDAQHRARWDRAGDTSETVRTRADLERALRVIVDSRSGRISTTWVEPLTSLRPWLKMLPA